MRDFYDVWLLSRLFDFDGEALSAAIERTFERRTTAIPSHPTAFTEEFATSREKQAQWSAFLRKSALTNAPQRFAEAIDAITGFLAPVMLVLSEKKPFRGAWKHPGPWR